MAPTDSLTPGLKGSVTVDVTEEKSALHVGSGSVDVFATPMLVAVMEAAACAAVDPHLGDDHTSLGLKIDVLHTAATPIGMMVTADAELTDVSGRKLQFKITARDNQEVVGTSTHTRVVVDRARFAATLSAKKNK